VKKRSIADNAKGFLFTVKKESEKVDKTC